MTYRPEDFPKDNSGSFAQTLDIALHVKEFVQGSYSTSVEDHQKNVKALEWILDN